jgi:F0F1-type ATP synthase gamma subunit
MKTVNEINEELRFNKELMNVLDVLKSISIYRFHSLHDKKRRFPRFDMELHGFYSMVDLRHVKHPFINPRSETTALIMITSDEGFMGDLNLQVIDVALTDSHAYRAELFVVGERGARQLRDIGRTGYTTFKSALTMEERFKLAIEMKDAILAGAKQGRFGRVFTFYPKPVSFLVQQVDKRPILPLEIPPPAPRVGKVIIESPLSGVINYLAEEDVVYKFVDLLEDSKLSEYASRAVHLEGSTRELEEKEKDLKYEYFRASHELIDKNIRELFSAQAITKKSTGYRIVHGR